MATTETEIFQVLEDGLRRAAEDCRDLAWHPRRGHVYLRFRAALKGVEGAATQAYWWRGFDARWLEVAKLAGWAQDRAGDWLRGAIKIRDAEGDAATLYTGGSKAMRREADKRFKRLADLLSYFHGQAVRGRTMATGRSGPIVPPPLPGPHRDTIPVGWRRGPAGLALPPQ